MQFLVGNNGGTKGITILNDGEVRVGEYGASNPTPTLTVSHNSNSLPNSTDLFFGGFGISRNKATNVTTGDSLGGISWFGSAGSPDVLGPFAAIGAICAADPGGGASTIGDLVFYTTPSGRTGVERARILSGGNVGIGTDAPNAKLNIISTTEQQRIGYDASNYYSTTVGSTGGVTFNAVGSGSAFTFSDPVTITNATITNLTLPTNGQILLTVPTSDGHATGPTTNAFVSGYTSSAIGDLVYLDSSGKWQKTDADALATTTGLLGIALAVAATDASLLVALPGSFVYATAFPTLTIGAPYYVGETPGAISATIPTGADNAVRVVGFAIHADKLFFNPSSDVATVVA